MQEVVEDPRDPLEFGATALQSKNRIGEGRLLPLGDQGVDLGPLGRDGMAEGLSEVPRLHLIEGIGSMWQGAGRINAIHTLG